MTNTMQPKKDVNVSRIVLLIFVIIGIIGFTLFIWRLFASKDTSKNSSTKTISQPTDVVGNGKLQPNQQKNKGDVTTDCYEFTVPRSISLGNSTYCDASLAYGSTDANQLVITGQSVPLKDGQYDYTGALESIKRTQAAAKLKLEKEEKFSLAGQEAMKYFFVNGNNRSVIVLGVSKNQSIPGSNGLTIRAIQLANPYNTDEQKQVLQGVIDTWKWK